MDDLELEECPLCANGDHQSSDDQGRCTCCGYDLSQNPPVVIS